MRHHTQHHSERDDGRRPEQGSAEESRPPEVAGKPMKCVWSGYPDYNRDCRSRIPATVVVKAWHREIQLKGTVEGFFYFTWRHGRWLAYGLQDGKVRGVYCPTHSSERDLREPAGEEVAARPEEDGPLVRRTEAPREAAGRIDMVEGVRGAVESVREQPSQSPAREAAVVWPAYAVGRSAL